MARETNQNLTHNMAHSLGMEILQGKYSPETEFPSEAQLCEMFSVSRSATREAVKMLTAKGLLTSRPRQGIRILPESEWNMFDHDVLHWMANSRSSHGMLRDFLQMRMAVEPEAAYLAATIGDQSRIELIGKAVQRMYEAVDGYDNILESDIEFHTNVLYASSNRFFMHMRPFCETALRVSIRYTNRLKGVSSGDPEEHEQVYLKIKNGDAEGAKAHLKRLIQEAEDLVANAPKPGA